MKIINKLLSRKEFVEYIREKKITRYIDKIVLHHTHSTITEWKKGERSVKYYKDLYEEKGWDSGPHFFVAPEGIWLFTDINIEGIHANDGNEGSVGIEMIGRYDAKAPSGEVWNNTKLVLNALIKKIGLSAREIHLHRKYNSSKSCPGRAVTYKWLMSQL